MGGAAKAPRFLRRPTPQTDRQTQSPSVFPSRLAVVSAEVADALLQRLRPWVPAHLGRRRLVACNPNVRLYRYEPGQRFGGRPCRKQGPPRGSAITVPHWLRQNTSAGGAPGCSKLS